MHQIRTVKRPINLFLLTGVIFLLQFGLSITEASAQQSDSSMFRLRYPLESGYGFPFSNSGIGSPLLLPPPSNVKQTVVYDPSTNSYVFSETIGDLDYRPPSMMSFNEYQGYKTREMKSDYWREKSRESSGAGPGFMKGLRLGNESIDKVFGSEAISITPQGSAELIFGYSITNNKNPQIPIRNQRNGSFIFKEKIMMNVTGSVGDKLEVGLNYNTEASFNFENKTKLEYTGKEDEIIKKIEAGDVSFSLPGTLINGSQSLFGIHTELQFGRLTVSTVFSSQEGESSSINVQGGAQKTEFEIDIDKYDVNRHFFLSHFFRDNYNEWLENPQNIESQVQIESIEVWVVNRQSNFESSRNIVGVMDLAEGFGTDSMPNFIASEYGISPKSGYNHPAENSLNRIYEVIAPNPKIRDVSSVKSVFDDYSNEGNVFYQGRDYVTLENARPLSAREFTVNRELGYISLNSPLRNDEILAVAYVYSYKGEIKKVGEMSNDVNTPNALIVKLLKGTTQTPSFPNWDLMMKNVYSIGAFQVSPDDFILNVLYRNDKTGVSTNVLKGDPMSDQVDGEILLKVLEFDNLDTRNEPYPDGMFDFVEGVTINSKNGRIFFPLVEPFGSDLRKKMLTNSDGEEATGDLAKLWSRSADKYVYEELYDSTQTAAQQVAEKNKFYLQGTYKSSNSSDIMLNAMNIPKGSVKVTAGGVLLTENVDYTVDYNMGRVRILNQGLMESGTPIKVSLESNSFFNMQQKTLMGTHLDYKFSENFNIGGTLMRLNERPLTEKVNVGEEPISNTIWGLNTSYRTESQFLTTLVDAIPLIETKETSSIIIDGEFAQLIPGQSKAIDKNSEALIDDFEGAQTKIELKSFPPWTISSPPITNANSASEFYNSNANGIESGYGRAKLAWYVIDPLFYGNSSSKPPLDDEVLNSHKQREILVKEIFPNKDDDIPGFKSRVSALNLNFYPNERGPYNYDDGSTGNELSDPESRWGGMMREIITTDFEASNVEYIEFWLMDPYLEEDNHSGGDLFFHLGEISEDILRDNRKTFENGFPTTEVKENVEETEWGYLPIGQSLVNAFDNDPDARQYQDIGLDGLYDEEEKRHEAVKDLDDPSNDNFEYYLSENHDGGGHDIMRRYKNFNGLEGNSPVANDPAIEYAAANKSTPDVEDINEDNTLNNTETYYQYRVSLRSQDFSVGKNFIVDEVVKSVDGNSIPAKWYQFRIPISDFEQKVGPISDFKSIRFLRIVMSNFEQPVVARFATLELVRGEWRRYDSDLQKAIPSVNQQHDMSTFEVSSVNIEENGKKTPVNYVLPPEVTRATDPSQTQVKMLNEQSLLLKFENLQENDGRAIYKNTQLDLRQYKNLKMFIHTAALVDQENELQDGDVTAFIRIGSDYKDNYYEYEIPLKVTPHGQYTAAESDIVWPNVNELFVDVQKFVDLKVARNNAMDEDPLISTQSTFVMDDDDPQTDNTGNKIKVKGNPNLSNIRQIMIGVRNPGNEFSNIENDGLQKSGEIWFNELRLTDFHNEGGWAANGRVQAKLADLGIVNFAGATSKPGFGSIEQKTEERQQEEINQIDVSSNLELGKFFPEKAKVTIPFYVGYSNTTVNPKYYPKDPDRKLEDVLKETQSESERDEIKKISQDKTERSSLNVTNVRWNKQFKKYKVFQPSNLSATVLYTETRSSNYSLDYNKIRKYGANLNYVYNSRPKPIEPLKKWKPVRKPAYRIIRDFNFNPMPSGFTFGTKFDRNYQSMLIRNVYEDQGIDLVIDPTTSKGFYWDRNYTLRWDLTKALKFNYSANNNAIIDEPREDINGDDYRQSDWFESGNSTWKDTVWHNIMRGGRNMQFNQKFGLSYTLPLNKIPILNWTNIKASYDGTSGWTRGPIIASGEELGHTLKNGNTIKLQGNFNMKNLYSKVDYFKQLDRKYSGRGKKESEKRYKTVEYSKRTFAKKDAPKSIVHKLGTEDVTVKVIDSEGNEVKVKMVIVNSNKITIESDKDITGITVLVEGKIEKGENPIVFVADQSVRLLLGFKNVNLTYSTNSSTMLNGYLPETHMMGFDMNTYDNAPGWPFILGVQDENITTRAHHEQWLTDYESFNKPTLHGINENFSYSTTYQPFKGFRIDFKGSRTYSRTSEQKYQNIYGENNAFERNIASPYETGNYKRSVITIGTAFEDVSFENNWDSKAYNTMKDNRGIISQRLSNERTEGSEKYTPSINRPVTPGYGDGYSSSSSDVLMYSFLSAYTGADAETMSLDRFSWMALPGWKVTINGLEKLGFVKDYLKTLTISHSYKSVYSIGQYGSNEFFEEDGDLPIRDIQGDFLQEYRTNSVSINEQISPLIGFDMTWHSSLLTKFEIKRSRLLSMSLNNQQLSESRNRDIVVGAGYRFKDVLLKISTVSGGGRTLKSDVNVRFDVSWRDNVTILRSLNEISADKATTGARKFVFGFTADYVMSDRVNTQFYVDWDKNTPWVSNYYPRSEFSFGFSIRLSL